METFYQKKEFLARKSCVRGRNRNLATVSVVMRSISPTLHNQASPPKL